MVWLILQALGFASQADQLLRKRISIACPASEMSGAVTLVGELSLLLIIQRIHGQNRSQLHCK